MRACLLLLFNFFFIYCYADAPVTILGNGSGCPGTYVTSSLTVNNFSNISSISLRIEYNPSCISFDTAININSQLAGLMFNNVNISSSLSKIIIIWTDINPVSLDNGSKILDLVFIVVSGSSGLTFNNVSNNGGDCEYADLNGDPLIDTPTTSYYTNGLISEPVAVGGNISGSKMIVIGQNTGNMQLSGNAGDVVIWQKQYNEDEYADIPGTSGFLTYSEVPIYTGTWHYRVMVQNGTCSQQYSSPAEIIVIMTPGGTRTWTGAISDDWIHPGNWNPGGVPVSTDNLFIPAGVTIMPELKNSGLSCNSLTIGTAADLTIIPGASLQIISSDEIGPSDYVAYWPLDGNFNDESGNGYNAAPTGNLSFVTGAFGSGVTNFISQSYFTLPNLNLSIGSLSAWVFFYTHATQKVFRSEGTSLCIGEWAGGWEACGANSYPVTLNTWHHFTVVDGIGLYIDGVLLYPSAVGCDASINVVTYVGGPPYAEWLHGIVDEIKWYDRALTPVEVIQLANQPFEGK